ncbi:MAG: hypothetical protein LKG19_14035 [Saprospiraceae bacterium]|jgi:hypothetical protein|nr:hypothetical protein [Saprospiraceae bacterium]
MNQELFPFLTLQQLDHTDQGEQVYIEMIQGRVEELLSQDPNLLFSYLYRLDIDESILQHILKTSGPDFIAYNLAHEIWRRQKTRLQHKASISINKIKEPGWENW